MAVLEIPELQAQLEQDKAAIKNMGEQVTHAEHELGRVEAQHKVAHLQYDRLQTRVGIQAGAGRAAGSGRLAGKGPGAAKRKWKRPNRACSRRKASWPPPSEAGHDQVLYDYSRITAPFAGVVTQRYANLAR